jgi:hypothetical protein
MNIGSSEGWFVKELSNGGKEIAWMGNQPGRESREGDKVFNTKLMQSSVEFDDALVAELIRAQG